MTRLLHGTCAPEASPRHTAIREAAPSCTDRALGRASIRTANAARSEPPVVARIQGGSRNPDSSTSQRGSLLLRVCAVKRDKPPPQHHAVHDASPVEMVGVVAVAPPAGRSAAVRPPSTIERRYCRPAAELARRPAHEAAAELPADHLGIGRPPLVGHPLLAEAFGDGHDASASAPSSSARRARKASDDPGSSAAQIAYSTASRNPATSSAERTTPEEGIRRSESPMPRATLR